MLNILDEFSRECLMIHVRRKLNSIDVINALSDLFILRGVPAFIRSDNSPEFIALAVSGSAPWGQKRLISSRDRLGMEEDQETVREAASPTTGYCESFNAQLCDEFLNGEVFYSLHEAQILIEQWRVHYNTKQPHSALGYHPPPPEAILPMDQRPVMH